jgi:hypothetical protein
LKSFFLRKKGTKNKVLTYFCNSDANNKFCFTFVHCFLPMKDNFITRKSDWIGILGSIACLIHCLALPALFYLFQFAMGFHQTVSGHWLEYAFVAVAMVAVATTVKKSTSLPVKILLISSLFLFTSGILLESVLTFSAYLLHLGSLGLITGHSINIFQQHRKSFKQEPTPIPVSRANSSSPTPMNVSAYTEAVTSRAC